MKKEPDLSEYYRNNKQTFIIWLYNKIDKRTADFYISCLDKHLLKAKIRSPKDMQEFLMKIDSSRNWFIKAVRNLLNFAEERDELSLEYITKLRKILKVKPSGVREIYITDEELKEAYQHIREELKPAFKLLVFSGLRLTHAYGMLQNFDSSNLVIKDNIARYPVSWLSKGTKRGYWAYMPVELAEELEGVKLYENYWTYVKGLKYGRVSANAIRKWHYNKLIELGVPESIADFIQGRASVTVGSRHYLAKTKQADEWYSKVVDNLKAIK